MTELINSVMKTIPAPGLNPTLWRTCRVLAGATRLRLLQRLLKDPGRTVSALAEAEQISRPRASQELRRLQSRGLLRAERRGAEVRYWPLPDPQVGSAAPILRALEKGLHTASAAGREEIRRLAAGPAHPRRVEILRVLQAGPQTVKDLCRITQIPFRAMHRHLHCLQASGWAMADAERWQMQIPPHPLADCLRRLL